MAEEAQGDEFRSPGIGERLQQAREAKGLSVEDVASQTRIPIRHLNHIEHEQWDALPAPTYCIGFVRSYANAIGLDGAELGRELREQLGTTRSRVPTAEYYEPADPARVPPRSLAIVAGLIALVLVAGYLIWRSSLDQPQEPAAVADSAPQVDAPAAGPRPQPRPQPPPPSRSRSSPPTRSGCGSAKRAAARPCSKASSPPASASTCRRRRSGRCCAPGGRRSCGSWSAAATSDRSSRSSAPSPTSA